MSTSNLRLTRWSRLLLSVSLVGGGAYAGLLAAVPAAAASADTCGYPAGTTGLPATVFNEDTLATWIQANGTSTISAYANDENGIILGVTDTSSAATVTPFATSGSTTLTSPIVHNTQYTTLSVKPLSVPYALNDQVVISQAGQNTNTHLTVAAPAGATTLQVQQFNPNQDYGAGSALNDQQVDQAAPYGHASQPQVGDVTKLDASGRPQFPAIFITNLTVDGASSAAGDWQQGGMPQSHLDDIFGTWVTGAYDAGGNYTKPQPPAVQNKTSSGYLYGPGSDAPMGTLASSQNDNYGTELRWNISSLRDDHGNPLVPGDSYRFQVILHDGDQNKGGGDVGELCTNLSLPPGVVVPEWPTGSAGLAVVGILALGVVVRRRLA